MIYKDKNYQKERTLYAISDSEVINCKFEGKEDGESPLKECKNIRVNGCVFKLRYPFWHNDNTFIKNSSFDDTSRAPFWYCNNLSFDNVVCDGVKAVREVNNVNINNSHFHSEEFGWKCNKITLLNSIFEGPYFMFASKNLNMDNCKLYGKYSFQYMDNVRIENSFLKTKDAFWHCENVIVINSVLEGEYIGWYSKNLTLINCKIKGTQPFCYCQKLKLINCEMIDADFAFENSTVNATLKGSLISIKNPIKGRIIVDRVDEIILDEYKKKGKVEIIQNNNK